MVRKLKIGFIGAGYISQVCHLPFFLNNKNCKIIAIVEKNKTLLNKVANRFKVQNRFTDYKDIIKKKLFLDAVVICVNKFLTSELSSFFLKKKIAVFSEKPIAISLNSAKKLNELAKKYKTPLVVGFMKRHDYGSKIIKEFIQTKKIQNIKKIQYDSLMGDSFPKKYNYIGYRKPFVKVNLNKLLNNKIKHQQKYINFLNNHSHGINLIRYYTGDKNKLDLEKIDLKKNYICMKYKNLKIHFNFDYSKKGKWKERILIYLKNGKIKQIFPAPQLNNASSKVTVSFLNKKKNKKFFKKLWSFKIQADAFIDNIIKKKNNICQIDKCIDDMKIIEKIFIQ